MRRAGVVLFRAFAAVIGGVAYRLTRYPPTGDQAAQRAWMLGNRSVPPALASRKRPRRRYRHGGYGNAGAELSPR